MSQETPTITLRLNEAQTNLVLNALLELPAKLSLDTILEVNRQIQAQQQAPAETPKAAGKGE